MSIKIANLTPHPINLKFNNNNIIEIKPHGFVLRIKEEIKNVGELGGIKIIQKELISQMSEEEIEKLKEIIRKHDIIIISFPAKELIVKMYGESVISRDEAEKFYIIGQVVRDEKGRVLYAESLAKII